MKTLTPEVARWGFPLYDARWRHVTNMGRAEVALDTRVAGRRYLSLDPLVLSPAELRELRELTVRFAWLLTAATEGLIADREYWSQVGWPWPALEMAAQEVPGRDGVTAYGRFDWLLAADGHWRLIEFNADTPSGGRETSGLEPAIRAVHRAVHPELRTVGGKLKRLLVNALQSRIADYRRRGTTSGRIGIVSCHSWLEDMSQAFWLTQTLRAVGEDVIVGDVNDLEVGARGATVRGRRIDALYRFYPVELLYRRGVFAPLIEAALDGRLLLLNGLRGFLAQSKTALAWLWDHRRDRALGPGARSLIEAHLPATYPVRAWKKSSHEGHEWVVKHANGREGNAVRFETDLQANDWDAYLLDGAYVVQERVRPIALSGVTVDELTQSLLVQSDRVPCVGSFAVGAHFGGAYTRLDGPVTGPEAQFVATLWDPRG